jgi:hypothetical protein
VKQCPWTGRDANCCTIETHLAWHLDYEVEVHVAWHLDYEVEMGRMVKNEDGTYQLVTNPPSSYPGGKQC